jgi:hypothetical protein
MAPQDIAIAIGAALVGVLCIWGAIAQWRSGETRGATGKGRVRRDEEPVYFWYMFAVRIVLGPIALILGLIALHRA